MKRFNPSHSKRRFFTALIIALFLMAFFVDGCIFESVKKINNDNTQAQVPNLEDQFGGYKATDEAAGFGDREILDEFGEDQEVVDLLSQDPQILSDMENPAVDVRFLRITWGMLEGDTSAANVIDWSGFARIDQGMLVLTLAKVIENLPPRRIRIDHLLPLKGGYLSVIEREYAITRLR